MLGNFRLERRLGSGGMGIVYFARHVAIGSRVAVKVLHEDQCKNPQLVERFYREARAVNVIGHENLVSIYDLTRAENGRFFLVMEYLDGAPLSAFAGSPMKPEALVPLLVQACGAVHAAHGRGIVHRDLKPDNLFLVRRPPPQTALCKVLDFGIAQLRGTNDAPAGYMLGTPAYMAPEQWGDGAVGAGADIYSLGMTAFRLLTGRFPWAAQNLTELMAAHKLKPVPPPHTLSSDVSEALSEVILKALAKEPADRYASAAEFGGALLQAVPAAHSHAEALRAKVMAKSGRFLAEVPGAELTRAGMFLVWQGLFPPVFTPLVVQLSAGDAAINLEAEVVRHVGASEAAAWGTAPGIAIQFVNLTEPQKDGIAQLLATRNTEQLSARSENTQQVEAEVVRRVLELDAGAHYEVLAVPEDSETTVIRGAAFEKLSQLDAEREKPGTDQAKLNEAYLRINRALTVLANPRERALYDALRGNFAGVMRCIISENLDTTEVKKLEESFLRRRPTARADAAGMLRNADSAEASGQFDRALDLIKAALSIDPLNVDAHDQLVRVQQLAVRRAATA